MGGFWTQLLFLIGAGVMIFFIIRMVKGNPGAFSKEALGKSFSTMGILALILIAFIALCVFMLRH